MKAFRIVLSTILGLAVFYCSSAVSHMSSPYADSYVVVQTNNAEIEYELPEDKIVKTAQTSYEASVTENLDAPYLQLSSVIAVTGEDFRPGKPNEILKDIEDYAFLEDADYKAIEFKIHKQRAYSTEEKLLIARVVYAEARGEIFEGQVAVAAVVLNRYESCLYGSSIRSIIFAPYQFAVSDKHNNTGLKAVEEAIETRGDYPYNMFYFQVSKSRAWRNFVYFKRIGNHSFYLAGN